MWRTCGCCQGSPAGGRRSYPLCGTWLPTWEGPVDSGPPGCRGWVSDYTCCSLDFSIDAILIPLASSNRLKMCCHSLESQLCYLSAATPTAGAFLLSLLFLRYSMCRLAHCSHLVCPGLGGFLQCRHLVRPPAAIFSARAMVLCSSLSSFALACRLASFCRR